MKIFGFDITSVPSKNKPVTVAVATLHDLELHLDEIVPCTSVAAVGDMLSKEGPWVAGMDFPFGLPQEFVRASGWPDDWAGYVRCCAALDKQQFAETVYSFMNSQPKGRKLLRRVTDVPHKAVSPMSLSYVPVGRMFHVYAPMLLGSPLDVFPVRPSDDNRTVFEVYPAVLARAVLAQGKGKPAPSELSYKDGKPEQRANRSANRARLVSLLPDYLEVERGVSLVFSPEQAALMRTDRQGDYVDALLCAIQAAYAVICSSGVGGLFNSISKSFADKAKCEGWIVS